jgi:LysM repeat protein
VRPVARIARIAALVAAIGVLALAGLAGTGRHTIKRGETLSAIARKYHTTVGALVFANGIKNPNHIVAGTALAIPDGSDAPASSAASTTTYVVRAGDTLASIAKRFGTTPSVIQFANSIKNPNLVVIGKALTIPAQGAARTSQIIEKVRPGDTIQTVSARTGVPVDLIASANGLRSPYALYTGGQLYLGMRNTVPTAPLARCPVPGARFMNDWGFPRSDTGFHEGNDLMAKRGTQLLAVANGKAAQIVGTIGGNQVKFTADDGTVYWYAHLDTFGKSGRVKAGAVLGTMGDTGDAKGGPVHLHFEVHPGGGAAMNPYPLLVDACR